MSGERWGGAGDNNPTLVVLRDTCSRAGALCRLRGGVADCLPPLKGLRVQEERDRLRLDFNELEERVNPHSFSPPPPCLLCGKCLLITPIMLACVCTCMCTAVGVPTATPSLTCLSSGCVRFL